MRVPTHEDEISKFSHQPSSARMVKMPEMQEIPIRDPLPSARLMNNRHQINFYNLVRTRKVVFN